MGIDDKLEKVMDKLLEESHDRADLELLKAAISAIPVAGSPISSLMSGQAKRKVVRRTIEMFNAMRERLEEVEEKKIDKDCFESDEFQTLLALAIEQLQTTHDTEKMRMLATGLANSGVEEHRDEARKELLIRILRDLSPDHIAALRDMSPRSGTPDELPARLRRRFSTPIKDPTGDELAIIEGLVSHGLVEQSIESRRRGSIPNFSNATNPSSAVRELKKYIDQSPSRRFQLSELGLRFLDYFGNVKKTEGSSP